MRPPCSSNLRHDPYWLLLVQAFWPLKAYCLKVELKVELSRTWIYLKLSLASIKFCSSNRVVPSSAGFVGFKNDLFKPGSSPSCRMLANTGSYPRIIKWAWKSKMLNSLSKQNSYKELLRHFIAYCDSPRVRRTSPIVKTSQHKILGWVLKVLLYFRDNLVAQRPARNRQIFLLTNRKRCLGNRHINIIKGKTILYVNY